MEASTAKAKASANRQKAATVAVGGSATAGVTQTPGVEALHLPWPALLAFALVAAAGVAVWLWRAKVHAARGEAYTAVAQAG